ncbi:MAG: N-formylglutamate amidohydrolase [Alphaproteobacteria bacterium]
MTLSEFKLLEAGDPSPVTVIRPDGASPFLLVCDHAGNHIPRKLGTLGVSESDRRRHIAWDVGAAEMAERVSELLDAPLVLQSYSRLVIDCNRDPKVESAMPLISETTEIPGNRDLDPREVEARIAEIFRPYHDRITAMMDARAAAGRPTILVALHSFTPYYAGWGARPWHIGILYNRDDRLPRIMLELLGAEPDLTVGDNEPYKISDETDYTIPVHGERRGVVHVEIEVRHDEIETGDDQLAWAERLVHFLRRAAERLETMG